ncbi:hypothetical protein [Streptomyces huasconensis]|uniref:hypothetical protein n=1 Tax=Streptomyces huasconensis TaxID=1854574 RepID=UPI0033C43600
MFSFDLVALVHDPALPNPDDDAQAGQDTGAVPPDGQGEVVDDAAAAELLTQVIARYAQLIHTERRTGTDPRRLDDLVVQHQAGVQDRAHLAEADAEEVARLAALYAARLKELQDP